jgi:nitrite reductase (NADH) small subunit
MTPTLDTAVAAATTGDWIRICTVDDIPVLGSRVVSTKRHGDIAIFRTSDDAVFALHDQCPHKGGPLSQGIVHGRSVTCPLHAWKIGLDTGEAAAPDVGCVRGFAVKVDAGDVYLSI